MKNISKIKNIKNTIQGKELKISKKWIRSERSRRSQRGQNSSED